MLSFFRIRSRSRSSLRATPLQLDLPHYRTIGSSHDARSILVIDRSCVNTRTNHVLSIVSVRVTEFRGSFRGTNGPQIRLKHHRTIRELVKLFIDLKKKKKRDFTHSLNQHSFIPIKIIQIFVLDFNCINYTYNLSLKRCEIS